MDRVASLLLGLGNGGVYAALAVAARKPGRCWKSSLLWSGGGPYPRGRCPAASNRCSRWHGL